MAKSEYDQLKKKRGRPPLTGEAKVAAEQRRKVKAKLRQESHRRANAVLAERYADEFKALVAVEAAALAKDERYRLPA